MRTLSQSQQTNARAVTQKRIDEEQSAQIHALIETTEDIEDRLDIVEAAVADQTITKSTVTSNTVNANIGDIDYLTSNEIEATSINATNMEAGISKATTVQSDYLTNAHDLSTSNLVVNNNLTVSGDTTLDDTTASSVATASLSATNGTITSLESGDINVTDSGNSTGSVTAKIINADTINTESFVIEGISAGQVSSTEINGMNASFADTETTELTADVIQSTYNTFGNGNNFIDITQTASDTNYIIIKVPNVNAGTYRMHYVNQVTGEVYFSCTINNTFDNNYFSYYRGFDPTYLEQVAIKDNELYFKTRVTGRLYYTSDTLENITPPSTYGDWPIDIETELDYPLFNATRRRATVYTNFVNIGMEDNTFGTAILDLYTGNEYDRMGTQGPNIQYDPNTDTTFYVYYPDQNVNTTESVSFHELTVTGDNENVYINDGNVSLKTLKIRGMDNNTYLIKRSSSENLVAEAPTDNQADNTALNRTVDNLITERSIANWNGATNRQYVPGGSGSTETMTYGAVNNGKYCFEAPTANLRLNSSSHDDAAASMINQNDWNYAPVNAFPFVCEELEVQPGSGTRWHTIYAMPITRDTSTPYSGDATLEALPGYRDTAPAPEDEGVIAASQHIYDNYEGLLLLSVTTYDSATPARHYARIVVKNLSGYTSASDFVADNSEWFIPKTDGTYAALSTIIGSPVDIFHGQIGPYVYKINNVTFTTISNGGFVLGTSADAMTPFYVYAGSWQSTTSGSVSASAALESGKPVGGYVNGKSTPLLWTDPDSDVYILDSFNHFTGVPTTGTKSSTGPVIIVDSANVDFVSVDSTTGEMTLDWLNNDAQYSSSINHVNKIIEGEWDAGDIKTPNLTVTDTMTINGDTTHNGDLNVTGDVSIGGDLTVTGKVISVDTETLTTEENTIELRHNAQTGIVSGEYSGLVVNNFDGQGNDLKIVSDSDGILRIGHNNLESVATRDEPVNLTNDHLMKWDSTGNKLVDSGKSISDLESELRVTLKELVGNDLDLTGVTTVAGVFSVMETYRSTNSLDEVIYKFSGSPSYGPVADYGMYIFSKTASASKAIYIKISEYGLLQYTWLGNGWSVSIGSNVFYGAVRANNANGSTYYGVSSLGGAGNFEVIANGNLTLSPTNALIIPTSAPGTLVNGAIWIS